MADDIAEGWIDPAPQNPGGTNPPEMLKKESTVELVEESTEEMPEPDSEYGDRAPGEVPAEEDQGDRAPGETYQSVETVAKEVVQGRWGVGQARRAALKRAGYDPNAVEEEVKQIRNHR